jgi:hypothetical protein
LLSKLQASFHEDRVVPDEEVGTGTFQMDCGSTGSDLSDVASRKEEEASASQKTPYLGMHKRLGSDSNAIFVFKEVCIQTNDPVKARHQRAPTCPTFPMMSSITLDTEDTISLTDSKCTMADDQLASVIERDLPLKVLKKPKEKLHCYDAFVSFSRNEPNLDGSFHIIRRMSQSNLIDVTLSLIDVPSVCQLTSKETMKELRKVAFRRLFQLPSLYLSILHTTAGFMLTVGALELGLSPWSTRIFYFIGSAGYLSDSTCILFLAWVNIREEWNLLQESRMALHSMTYPKDDVRFCLQ